MEGDRAGTVGDPGQMRRHRQNGNAVPVECIAGFHQVDGVERRIGKGLCRDDIGRLAIDRNGRSELADAALAQRRRIAAEKQRFLWLGRRIDEDRAGGRKQLRQFLAQFLAQLVVEVGERLVEQHEAGILDDGARKRRALLLAARQIERRALQIGRQLHQFGRLADFAVDRCCILAGNAHRRGDVLIDRHRRIVDELLVDHGDRAILHAHAGHVFSVKGDGAGRRLVEAGHQPHQRRLAGQRRAEQHVERPPLQHKIGRVDMRIRTHDLGYIFQFKHSQGFLPAIGGAIPARPSGNPADGLPHVFLQPGGFRLGQFQSKLGAAPQHVLGTPRPFLAH